MDVATERETLLECGIGKRKLTFDFFDYELE